MDTKKIQHQKQFVNRLESRRKEVCKLCKFHLFRSTNVNGRNVNLILLWCCAYLAVEFSFGIHVLCFVRPNWLGLDSFSEWAGHFDCWYYFQPISRYNDTGIKTQTKNVCFEKSIEIGSYVARDNKIERKEWGEILLRKIAINAFLPPKIRLVTKKEIFQKKNTKWIELNRIYTFHNVQIR